MGVGYSRVDLAVNLAAIPPPIDGAEKRVLAHSGRGVVPDYRKQSLRSFVPLAAKGPRALHETGNSHAALAPVPVDSAAPVLAADHLPSLQLPPCSAQQ